LQSLLVVRLLHNPRLALLACAICLCEKCRVSLAFSEKCFLGNGQTFAGRADGDAVLQVLENVRPNPWCDSSSSASLRFHRFNAKALVLTFQCVSGCFHWLLWRAILRRIALMSAAISSRFRAMIYEQIRGAEPDEVAKFLDAGKSVEQGHLRLALANALRRIADLTRRVKQLEDASR
jgi:hypothetical protein